MHVQKRLPTALTVLIYLASITVLAASPACAADISPTATTGQWTAGFGPGHHGAFNATAQTGRLQAMITNLSQQGIDVSQVQADLTAGNTTAVMQWFQQYRRDHPAAFGNRTGMKPMGMKPQMNTTAMAGHIQTMITKLGSQGVDISQVEADLTAGNTAAVMQWFGSFFQSHPATFGNRTGMKPTGMGSMMNATAQTERFQSLITKLGSQGVDISQVQADLTAGNKTAVMQWFQQYRRDHPGSTETTSTGSAAYTGTGSSFQKSGMHGMNRTAMAHHAGWKGTAS